MNKDENTIEYIDSEISETPEKTTDDRDKKKVVKVYNRSKAIRIIAIEIFTFVVLIGAVIAWFTMNREGDTGTMSIESSGQNFEVINVTDSGTRDGIFKDPYHIAVHEDDALYWEMTPTNNLENYNEYVDEDHPGDQGLHPGSEGVISFKVIPKIASVDLVFDFEIIGYQDSYSDVNNTPDDATDDELVMTTLSELSGGDGVDAQNLLNGHILLFEHRSGTAGNYEYSTPICSNEHMHRIFSDTVTTEKQIDIYWVWPNTLSKIVDASASGITTTPFCIDNDAYDYNSYTAITGNVESYPHYYLKGASSSSVIDAENDIGAHYLSYGDLYDQGDNEIGMRVRYLLIKLSVTEGTAGGGGS